MGGAPRGSQEVSGVCVASRGPLSKHPPEVEPGPRKVGSVWTAGRLGWEARPEASRSLTERCVHLDPRLQERWGRGSWCSHPPSMQAMCPVRGLSKCCRC